PASPGSVAGIAYPDDLGSFCGSARALCRGTFDAGNASIRSESVAGSCRCTISNTKCRPAIAHAATSALGFGVADAAPWGRQDTGLLSDDVPAGIDARVGREDRQRLGTPGFGRDWRMAACTISSHASPSANYRNGCFCADPGRAAAMERG